MECRKCGKLASSLKWPITINERLKVTSVSCFIPDFNLLSCELDNFTFEMFHYYTYNCYTVTFNSVISLYVIILKQKKIIISS